MKTIFVIFFSLSIYGQTISGKAQVGGVVYFRDASSNYTYYVDSANGSNGNIGHCTSVQVSALDWSACAFKTLAKVQAVMSDGESVCLTYGSYFQNQALSIPTLSHAMIAACGNPDLGNPFIDAAQIAVGSWTKYSTGGAYYLSITTPNLVDTSNGFSTFEDGAFLTLAASAVACDSTPGTYYIGSAAAWPGGNGTLYVNPTAGGNPSSNGHVYKFTSQRFAIDTWTPGTLTYPTIKNVTVCCQAGNDGGIRLGGGGTGVGIESDFGGKHNILLASQTTINGGVFRSANVTFAGNFVILYDSVAQGTGVSLTNVTVDGSGSVGGTGDAFDAHVGVGSFGLISINGWTLHGAMRKGLMGQNPYSVDGLTCMNSIEKCIDPAADTAIVTASHVTSHSTISVNIDPGRTVNLTNSSLDGYLFVYGNLNISDSTFTAAGGQIYINGSGGVVSSTGNIFLGSNAYALAAPGTIASDGNSFYNGASTQPLLGSSRAAWLATVCPANGNSVCVSPTTQDSHSTFH